LSPQLSEINETAIEVGETIHTRRGRSRAWACRGQEVLISGVQRSPRQL